MKGVRNPRGELGRVTIRWVATLDGQSSEYQVLADGVTQDPGWLAHELRKIADHIQRDGWGFVRDHPEYVEPAPTLTLDGSPRRLTDSEDKP